MNLTIYSQIKYESEIIIDGLLIGVIKGGKTFSISLNEQYHVLKCSCTVSDFYNETGLVKRYSNEIEIYGDTDYEFWIRKKRQGFFESMVSNNFKLEIIENDSQAEQRSNILNERKQSILRKKQEEDELETRVYDIIKKELDKDRWQWDFPKTLSVLSEGERENRGFKKALEFLVNLILESATKNYCYYELVFSLLNNIKEIPECAYEVEDILKYEDVLCDRQRRIASVFTKTDNFAEAYEKLEKKYLDKFQGYSITFEETKKYSERLYQIQETYNNKEYKRNVELQMFSDTNIEEFYELKELIIFTAMNPVLNEVDSLAIKAVESWYDYFVAPIKETEDSFEYIPTIDRIIAKTIIFSRVNLIDNVMEDLQKTLEVIANKDKRFRIYKDTITITTSQFEVLRKVFEYYKAPKQEVAVLETMYKYNIPRTIEQEQRLAFLKKGSINAPKMYENNTQREVFQYDYRVLQWSESDITNYIENFTMNSKKCTVPMAVSNFEKSVMVQSFQWENEAIIPVLEKCLQENFGDKYHVQNIQSATVTDSAEDSISAVLISETNSTTKGYPWLGFLVIGDQVTLKQMNLSIYAVYLPDKMAEHQNIVQANEKIISDVTVIKMKQNPRINNYISTVTNILVEVIEEWINTQMSYNIYD